MAGSPRQVLAMRKKVSEAGTVGKAPDTKFTLSRDGSRQDGTERRVCRPHHVHDRSSPKRAFAGRDDEQSPNRLIHRRRTQLSKRLLKRRLNI